MSRPVAVLCLLVATAIWGFAFVAQKTAMEHMGPFTFGAVRYLLGGIAILPLALFESRRLVAAPQLTAGHWRLLALMSVVFFLAAALQQVGLITTTATNGGFITSLYVLFVPLIAWAALRARPHPIIYLGAPLAITGIFYLNGGRFEAFNLGDGLIFLSALCWGGHVFLLGHLARLTNRPVLISAVSFFAVGAIGLVPALAFEQPNFAGIAAGWVEIAYVGLLSTAVAYTLQAVGQMHVPAANAAIILSAESLFAALGGALLLGERLPAIGYFGAAAVFAAILIVELVPAWSARRAPAG